MSLHRAMFATLLYCLYKLFLKRVDVNSTEFLVLCILGTASFVIGCIAKSCADDRAEGTTTTRDALILYCAYILITKFSVIIAFLAALLLMYYKHHYLFA